MNINTRKRNKPWAGEQHVLAEIMLNVLGVFFSIFLLAHRTTQTPAASSPAAKTTSLGLVLISSPVATYALWSTKSMKIRQNQAKPGDGFWKIYLIFF